YLGKMLYDGFTFKEENAIQPLKKVFSERCTQQTVYLYLREATKRTQLLDSTYIFGLMNSNSKKLAKMKDPYLNLSRNLYTEYYALDSAQTNYKTQLDALLPRYVDARMAALGQQFIPDANSTMRLTYGYIKGYSPADGAYYLPQTTVAGMLEKGGQSPDYEVNDQLAYVYKNQKDNTYYSAKLKDIPSGMLYNTDTSGGNSGSPVLNKYGQLIGLNFDRAYEATVNDYAWDDAYSRSIGLDIRFVLWTTQEVAGAKYLINEMFIDKGK
ncbi:MAG: S46 family peptidase, partial [Bacteroidia bacterium]